MSVHRRQVRIVIALVALSLGALIAPCAAGQEAGAASPAKHFQRGVALYGEADYRAALVEFKRAYALAPNVAVLYNVGETEYQLQDYASALTTFEKYLSEASPTEAHRGDVESTLDVLRARVGHLAVATAPPGADVTVDDQAVGKTPFEKSILVSIGRRKVTASMPGRPPVVRYVDIAADDTVPVVLQLPSATSDATPSSAAPQPLPALPHDQPPSNTAATLRTVGWATTGATGAGAIAFGLLAMKESNDLKAARASYPTSGATLTHDAGLTTAYSAVADSLAAAALLVGGITLVSAMSSSSSSGKRGTADPPVRVSLGLASARFEMSF
jgi:tetratricopeptide (TPR) repeat protein